MLIPLTSIAWWLALKHIVLRGVVFCPHLAGMLCFIRDDWSFSPYRDIGQMELLVVESLEDYSLGEVTVFSPGVTLNRCHLFSKVRANLT